LFDNPSFTDRPLPFPFTPAHAPCLCNEQTCNFDVLYACAAIQCPLLDPTGVNIALLSSAFAVPAQVPHLVRRLHDRTPRLPLAPLAMQEPRTPGGSPPVDAAMVKTKPINPRGFDCVNVLMQKAIKKVCKMARDREHARDWAKNNRERKRKNNKAYSQRHHKETLAMSEDWRQRNRRHVLDTVNELNRKKVESGDLVFIVKKRVRSRLRMFMKQHKTRKNNSTFEMVGISKEALVDYLSSLLQGNETIQNSDIDHIFPLEAYNLRDGDIDERCMHWSNTQPLPPFDNGSKLNKLPTKAMAAKVDPRCWPEGVTMDMLPDIYPGWATPLRMHSSGGASCSTDPQ